jgi:hypothetical protein
MTAVPSHERGRTVPLVAVVSRIPILTEALAAALDPHAKVEHFAAGREDTAGLLRYLAPDAVVVDNDADLREIEAIAREQGFTVLAVGLAERTLRLLDESGTWIDPPDRDPSAEVIRNIILARLFARKAVQ